MQLKIYTKSVVHKLVLSSYKNRIQYNSRLLTLDRTQAIIIITINIYRGLNNQ